MKIGRYLRRDCLAIFDQVPAYCLTTANCSRAWLFSRLWRGLWRVAEPRDPAEMLTAFPAQLGSSAFSPLPSSRHSTNQPLERPTDSGQVARLGRGQLGGSRSFTGMMTAGGGLASWDLELQSGQARP